MIARISQNCCFGIVIAASFLLSSVGCGGGAGDTPTICSVTGTLTVGGKPLQGVTVTLIPVAGGPSAMGKTAADGSFIIVTPNAGEGAVPGTHKVILSTVDSSKADNSMYSSADGDAPDEDPMGETGPIPKEYTNLEETPTSVKVEASGDTHFKIEI
jgi:hypothetical protein